MEPQVQTILDEMRSLSKKTKAIVSGPYTDAAGKEVLSLTFRKVKLFSDLDNLFATSEEQTSADKVSSAFDEVLADFRKRRAEAMRIPVKAPYAPGPAEGGTVVSEHTFEIGPISVEKLKDQGYTDPERLGEVASNHLHAILEEFFSAAQTHPKFNSIHEGYAVIREEFDELWDEIKLKEPSTERVIKEATQVAAMALRLIVDCFHSGL